MSLSDIRLLKPNVDRRGTSIQFAVYGHIVSIIGGFFMVVSALFNLFQQPLGGIIGILSGIIILAIELDELHIPQLKDPLYRGVTWVILGAVSFALDLYAIIVIFVAGALYIVYHNQ